MDNSSVVSSLVENSGGQLAAALKGIPSDQYDFKLAPHVFSVRETLNHLREVYQAVIVDAGGGKYEWGSHVFEAVPDDALISTVFEQREKAVKASEPEQHVKLCLDYIIGHDYYHVGQIVVTRLGFEPDWNSYVIYGY